MSTQDTQPAVAGSTDGGDGGRLEALLDRINQLADGSPDEAEELPPTGESAAGAAAPDFEANKQAAPRGPQKVRAVVPASSPSRSARRA